MRGAGKAHLTIMEKAHIDKKLTAQRRGIGLQQGTKVGLFPNKIASSKHV